MNEELPNEPQIHILRGLLLQLEETFHTRMKTSSFSCSSNEMDIQQSVLELWRVILANSLYLSRICRSNTFLYNESAKHTHTNKKIRTIPILRTTNLTVVNKESQK
jgi:hypothetical protein